MKVWLKRTSAVFVWNVLQFYVVVVFCSWIESCSVSCAHVGANVNHVCTLIAWARTCMARDLHDVISRHYRDVTSIHVRH